MTSTPQPYGKPLDPLAIVRHFSGVVLVATPNPDYTPQTATAPAAGTFNLWVSDGRSVYTVNSTKAVPLTVDRTFRTLEEMAGEEPGDTMTAVQLFRAALKTRRHK